MLCPRATSICCVQDNRLSNGTSSSRNRIQATNNKAFAREALHGAFMPQKDVNEMD